MHWLRWRTINAILWLCVLASLAALAGIPRVSFVRPPGIVSDTADVIYRVRVPPNDANRYLVVAASDGEGPVQRSDRELDGHSPALFTFKWRLPAGRLQLTAELYDAGGMVARDVWAIRVTSRFDEPEDEP